MLCSDDRSGRQCGLIKIAQSDPASAFASVRQNVYICGTVVADEVRLSGQLLQSGDFTHLLNHSALQAFNKLNQAVDIFSAVGLTFELIQAIADTERSLGLGEFKCGW